MYYHVVGHLQGTNVYLGKTARLGVTVCEHIQWFQLLEVYWRFNVLQAHYQNTPNPKAKTMYLGSGKTTTSNINTNTEQFPHVNRLIWSLYWIYSWKLQR